MAACSLCLATSAAAASTAQPCACMDAQVLLYAKFCAIHDVNAQNPWAIVVLSEHWLLGILQGIENGMCMVVSKSFLVLQELLDTPNPNSPAQSDAYILFTQKLSEYKKKVRQQASKYPPPS